MTLEFVGGDPAFLRATTRPKYLGRNPIRAVDLFARCGGMTLGAAEACRLAGKGFEVVIAAQLDDVIHAVCDKNFVSELQSKRRDVLERFNGQLNKSLTAAERATRREAGEADLLLGDHHARDTIPVSVPPPPRSRTALPESAEQVSAP